jgi:hypothetical protein
MCLELREKANEDPTFISRIITGDESWIYGYDPETKQQSLLWKSQKAVAGPEFNKEHAHWFFFDVKRIVHRVFVPPTSKMTINSFTVTFCDA